MLCIEREREFHVHVYTYKLFLHLQVLTEAHHIAYGRGMSVNFQAVTAQTSEMTGVHLHLFGCMTTVFIRGIYFTCMYIVRYMYTHCQCIFSGPALI